MRAIIKPLGMSEAELEAEAPAQGKRQKHYRNMLLELYRTAPPTLAEVESLERVLGPLPEDYRRFLMECNGGVPVPNTIVTASNERVVNFFFPLNHPLSYPDGFHSYREAYAGRIPAGMVPIASAGGGDLVLLATGNPGRGSIYYWDHHLESAEDAATYFDNVELIAASFDALLASFSDVD